MLASHIGKLETTLAGLGDKVKSLAIRNEDALDKAMEAGKMFFYSAIVHFISYGMLYHIMKTRPTIHCSIWFTRVNEEVCDRENV